MYQRKLLYRKHFSNALLPVQCFHLSFLSQKDQPDTDHCFYPAGLRTFRWYVHNLLLSFWKKESKAAWSKPIVEMTIQKTNMIQIHFLSFRYIVLFFLFSSFLLVFRKIQFKHLQATLIYKYFPNFIKRILTDFYRRYN